MFRKVLDGVNQHVHKLVAHICQVLHISWIAWFDTSAPASTDIGNSQWFQVWDLEHISEVVWQLKTIFRGFRHHIISNPSLHLMCLKVDFFDSHQSFWHKFQQETLPFFEIFFGMG